MGYGQTCALSKTVEKHHSMKDPRADNTVLQQNKIENDLLKIVKDINWFEKNRLFHTENDQMVSLSTGTICSDDYFNYHISVR